MAINSELISFIREARAKGFEDFEIRAPLLDTGWPASEIQKAFSYLKPKTKGKNRLQIYLDGKILKQLEKRANKNMLNLHEQIEDILRRSVLSLQKKNPVEEKVDDKFVTFFSRKKR